MAPERAARSPGCTGAAATRTRTCPAPGCGSGTCEIDSTSGPPKDANVTARMIPPSQKLHGMCSSYTTHGVKFCPDTRSPGVRSVTVSAMDPRNARSRRTREALLAAARSLIQSEGPAGPTMGAVAQRAGVSRRAVYLHFSSRAELITALFAYVNQTEDLAGSVRPVADAPGGEQALVEWAKHLARYHPRLIAIGRALQRAQDSDP